MKRLPEAERRRLAVLATKERFEGKPLDWRAGRHCVKLAHYHLRKMGRKVPSLPPVKSPLAAKKEMKARGWGSVVEMLDDILPGARIAPAFMALGDMMATEGEGGLQALCVCLGPRRVFGWSEGFNEPVVIEPDMAAVVAAWRV